jgi:hypothetical protein
MMSQPTQPTLDDLRSAQTRACQPTFAAYILEGRARVAAMPRAWVVGHILEIAGQCLNLSDYWEYGRLLEVLHDLGAAELLQQMVATGLGSADADVRDMAQGWSEKLA